MGSKDLAAYLVVTPEGGILINSNLVSSAPQILENIQMLGFKPTDVKVLLISHAHFDHAAGSAAIVRATHAKYEVMEGDVPVVESGGKPDFGNGGLQQYPKAKVDRVLHDGDEVRLGGMVLVAHLTPGHTKGCTTWTLKVTDAGKRYDVVIVGSTSVLDDYKLRGDPKYPNMAEDYARAFRVLHGLPCDVFLGSHAQFFAMEAKYGRMKAGEAGVFVDPAGYQRFVDAQEKAYLARLAKVPVDSMRNAERLEPRRQHRRSFDCADHGEAVTGSAQDDSVTRLVRTYAKRLRTAPTTPSKPVPSKTRLDGSGVAAVTAVSVPLKTLPT